MSLPLPSNTKTPITIHTGSGEIVVVTKGDQKTGSFAIGETKRENSRT